MKEYQNPHSELDVQELTGQLNLLGMSVILSELRSDTDSDPDNVEWENLEQNSDEEDEEDETVEWADDEDDEDDEITWAEDD